MPNEQKYLQSRGRHDHGPSFGAFQSRFRESLKGQIAWGKSLPESLGAFQQRILHDQTSSGNMATQAARGTYLHSKSVDIVEKYYAKSKTR